jgi:hypothetical protein
LAIALALALAFALVFALLKSARSMRAALPLPSAAAAGRRKSPKGGRHGCRPVWRQGRMPCRQTPQSGREPHGPTAREARKRGGLSLGYFSLLRASCPSPFGPASPFAPVPDGRVAKQREVTRPPQEDETLFFEPAQRSGERRARAKSKWIPASAGMTASGRSSLADLSAIERLANDGFGRSSLGRPFGRRVPRE